LLCEHRLYCPRAASPPSIDSIVGQITLIDDMGPQCARESGRRQDPWIYEFT
jgi:hypothetical protein